MIQGAPSPTQRHGAAKGAPVAVPEVATREAGTIPPSVSGPESHGGSMLEPGHSITEATLRPYLPSTRKSHIRLWRRFHPPYLNQARVVQRDGCIDGHSMHPISQKSSLSEEPFMPLSTQTFVPLRDAAERDQATLAACLTACLDCARACSEIGRGSPLWSTQDAHGVSSDECADMCRSTAQVLSRLLERELTLTRALVEACARTCASFRLVCESRGDAPAQDCARACLECEQACQRWVEGLKAVFH